MIQKIPLAVEYMTLVQEGRKTTTIRKGRRDIALGPAKFVSKEDAVNIDIVSVTYRLFAELSDDDAGADGFEDSHELRQALRSFYPEIQADDPCTIIGFQLSHD